MRRDSLFVASSILILACSASPPPPEQTAALGAAASAAASPRASLPDIDHMIVAIDSLERGMAQLRELTGVAPVFGGVHPGRGTQNALLSLGPRSYLELIAPNPRDSAGPRAVAAYESYRRLTPVGWALHATDVDSLRQAAISLGMSGGTVRGGSRVRDDGTTLSWRTVTPWSGERWLLPFFIQWGGNSPHPSATSPSGCTLNEVRLYSFTADSLRSMLGALGVRVPVETAQVDRMRLTLDCPKGRVTIP